MAGEGQGRAERRVAGCKGERWGSEEERKCCPEEPGPGLEDREPRLTLENAISETPLPLRWGGWPKGAEGQAERVEGSRHAAGLTEGTTARTERMTGGGTELG